MLFSARPPSKAQKSKSLFRSPKKPAEVTPKTVKPVVSPSPKPKKTRPKKPKEVTREARLEEYLKSKATNDSYRQGSQFESSSLVYKAGSKEEQK